MEPELNWLSLPDHNLENILLFLDFKSLLSATETCKKLQEICANSSKLCRKIRLKVIIDENMTSQLRVIQMSERKYFNLHLTTSKRIIVEDVLVKRGNLTKLVHIFGATVRHLKITSLKFRRETMAKLLTGLAFLKSLSFADVINESEGFDEDFSESEKALLSNSYSPEVEELEMLRSDFFYFYFLQNSLNLRKLVIDDMDMGIIDPELIEPVLAKMKNLKDFKLQNFSSSHFFSTDQLANPSFQLDSLSMTAVYWDAKDSGTSFFKSQRSLKTFHLALEHHEWSNWEEFWFNDILKHVFTFNHDLHTVSISTAENRGYNIQFTDFLDGIICPKVETLTYAKGREDDSSALMEAFVKMFPNLKHFVYKNDNCTPYQDLSLISRWTKLETLNVSDVYGVDLQEIRVTSPNFYKLEKTYYAAFSCHPTVRHLSLSSLHQGLSNFYCKILAENFPNLEILAFRWSYVFPKAIDMLCLEFKKLRLIQVDETIEANDEFRAAATKHGIEIKFDCV